MSHLNCAVLTFNCGREPVKPVVFARHLSKVLEQGPKHDLIVFSLQEISPISYGFIGGRCLSYYYNRLQEALKLATGQDTYVNIFIGNIGITAIMIYARRDCKDRVGPVVSGSVGVGWLEMGNKGAVGTKLSWKGSSGKHIHLTFIAAHLAPHEQGLERRNQDWMHIVQRLIFQSSQTSNANLAASRGSYTDDQSTSAAESEEHDPLIRKPTDSGEEERHLSTVYTPMSYTFVAGDLNYRTSNDRPKPDDYARYPKFSDSTAMINDLFKGDQLNEQRKKNQTLHGFKEADIKFPPTYKYTTKCQKELAEKEEDDTLTKQSDNSPVPLDWAQHRFPSWCDRILYLTPLIDPDGMEATIMNNFYKSLPLMSTSDHQPVIASFSIPLESTSSTIGRGIAEISHYRVKPPYAVDPHWMERFATARRREFVLGLLAYLGTTWEGNSILLAIFVGAAGVYLTSKFGLF